MIQLLLGGKTTSRICSGGVAFPPTYFVQNPTDLVPFNAKYLGDGALRMPLCVQLLDTIYELCLLGIAIFFATRLMPELACVFIRTAKHSLEILN